MKHILLFLIIFSLNSCGSSEQNTTKESIESNSNKESQAISDAEVIFDYSNTFFKTSHLDSSRHHFTNNDTKDLFIIYIPEGNINNTESYLRITKSDSTIIYEKKFSTKDLINGYNLYKIKNDAELISEIISRVKGNLDNASFVDLNSDENTLLSSSSKNEYENYEVYLECKGDNRPLYSFDLNEENITYFGYSPTLNKVVPVFYCC